MATAGYSNTPLLKKLGISPIHKLLLINPPPNYSTLLNTDLSNQLIKTGEIPDLIHLFVVNYKDFEAAMKNIKPLFEKNYNAVLWVSWYKKAAKIATDITEDSIRNYALKNKLVDIKVCAVSELWSGLKLVVRKADRK